MIRGAIAFGLVLNIDKSIANREVIVTTALTLVCFTTIFFGSLMPLVSKFLVPPKEEEKHEYDEKLEKGNLSSNALDLPKLNLLKDKMVSVHEVFIHPNFSPSTAELNIKRSKSMMER